MSEEKTDKEMQQELESQLHEQYAINNNSNLSSIITLFVTMLAVLGAYGHIFIHSSYVFGFDIMFKSSNYTLDALLIVAMASLIIITIMKHICLYQGFHQRYEQFVTYAIRFKYYKQKPENIRPRLFPDNYSPFYKNDKDIPQGLYGEFFSFLCWINLFICFSILAKLLYYICNFSIKSLPDVLWIELFIFILLLLLCKIHICCLRSNLKNKYSLLSQQYCYLNNNNVNEFESNHKPCEFINYIINYVNKMC